MNRIRSRGKCTIIIVTTIVSFSDVLGDSGAIQPMARWLETKVADVYVASAVSVHPGTAVFIVECLFGTASCAFLTDLLQVRGGFSTVAFLNQRTSFSVVADGNGSFRRRRGRLWQNFSSRACEEQR